MTLWNKDVIKGALAWLLMLSVFMLTATLVVFFIGWFWCAVILVAVFVLAFLGLLASASAAMYEAMTKLSTRVKKLEAKAQEKAVNHQPPKPEPPTVDVVRNDRVKI